MHPLRIVILLLLLYILYRLLTGRKRRPATAPPPASPPVLHDVLVEDPVCRAYIPKGQAVVLREDGVTRYFCSEHCREAFRAHPGDKA
ncbi:MAG: TRASH domain protein [Thermodesulfobacteriota bacterium]